MLGDCCYYDSGGGGAEQSVLLKLPPSKFSKTYVLWDLKSIILGGLINQRLGLSQNIGNCRPFKKDRKLVFKAF